MRELQFKFFMCDTGNCNRIQATPSTCITLCLVFLAVALAFPQSVLGQLGMDRDKIEAMYGRNKGGFPIAEDATPLPPLKEARSYPINKGDVTLTMGFEDDKVRYVGFTSNNDGVKPEVVSSIFEQARKPAIDKKTKPLSWSTDIAQTGVFPPLGKFQGHKGSFDGTFGPKMVSANEVTHLFREYSNGYREHISSRVTNTNSYVAIPGSDAPYFNYVTGHGVERLIRVQAGEQIYVTIEASFGTIEPHQIRSVLIADAETHWPVLFHSLMDLRRKPVAPWSWGESGRITYDAVLSSLVAPVDVPKVYESCLVDLVVAAAERDQLKPDLLQKLLPTMAAQDLALRAVGNMASVKVEFQRRRVRFLAELPAQVAVPQLIRRLSIKSLQSDAVATLQQIATRDPASQKSAQRLGVASAKWQKWWDANRSRLP